MARRKRKLIGSVLHKKWGPMIKSKNSKQKSATWVLGKTRPKKK